MPQFVHVMFGPVKLSKSASRSTPNLERLSSSQTYWGFGLFPSSGYCREHDVLETGSVSVLR
jgi:hypothetical protein